MSILWTGLKNEFKVKYFGFSDVTANRFYESQWGKNRLIYLAYRISVFLYSLGWIISDLVLFPENYWIYLTTWTEVTGCLYFLLAMLIVGYGYVTRCETDYELRWFHKITWIVYNTALPAALGTDILFWCFLSSRLSTHRFSDATIIHSHLINYILLLIDIFINDVPLRLLHCFYSMGYGITYIVFVLILHGVNYISAVYSLLDWVNTPITAVAYSLGSILVGLPLAFVVNFGFYLLRRFIASRWKKDICNDQPTLDSTTKNIELGENNNSIAQHV